MSHRGRELGQRASSHHNAQVRATAVPCCAIGGGHTQPRPQRCPQHVRAAGSEGSEPCSVSANLPRGNRVVLRVVLSA